MVFSKKNKDKNVADGAASVENISPIKERGAKAEPKSKKEKKVKAAVAPKPKKGGARRFVFIIGDEGCILVFMQGSKVIRRLFAPSAQPSHTEAMREIIRSNPKVPIYMLADVLDQQYIPHPFPPVSSLSIGGLVKRRLDRDFQPDDLKGALPLGRDKTGRKEWKFLLVALARTPLITEWLDLIAELPNEMKGVYLVPVEAVAYVGQLNKYLGNTEPRPWQLFISHNKISGFRQVVIHEGKLVFTRVSQAIDDAIPAVIAGNIEQEIINTIEYLKRLDFKENSDLDTTVVISQDVIDSLDLNRFGFNRAQALTPMGVASALGLEQAALTADRFGDVVMASAFGISKKRVLRFSTAYIDKLAKIYTARIGIRALAALAVLALAGMTVMTAIDIISDHSAIQELEVKSAKLKPDLEKSREQVKGLTDNVAFKSVVVAAYDAYLKDVPKPEEAATELMKVVTPTTRIVNMTWTYLPASGAQPAPAAGATTAAPVELKIEVNFEGSGTTADELSKAAKIFEDNIRAKLPYELAVEPYPWTNQPGKAEDSSLEVAGAATVAPQNMTTRYTLAGPKKGAAGTPNSPGQVTP